MSARNIVLLSDGTGNSAGKITKTNIWRIFQAIDLAKGDQLAFYDDGVGTSGVTFLRTIGGAFGYGLARNVRELYEHLCRHYRQGDRIFLFGFSRGAFTVRVLSGLIEHCGIIDHRSDKLIKAWRWRELGFDEIPIASDEGLKAAVRVAYRALRKEYRTPGPTKLYRWIRDKVFRLETPDGKGFKNRYSATEKPTIAFLGVFDTVSAYGLPVDELAITVHKWILPLRFPDMKLSDSVDNAVQALALDEARQTYHPMLWTEKKKDGKPDKRPHQVWFAGMHSDIGGGYSNERLSLVPALWMFHEAETRAGLRLRDTVVADLEERATEFGQIHDSRRGFGSFYRYGPRILDHLGNEDLDGNKKTEVQIEKFKIHQSVFERIKETAADYAPFGLPEHYDVIRQSAGAGGGTVHTVAAADKAGYESDENRRRRAAYDDAILDAVFWRKAAYYVMLVSALTIVLVPMVWLTDRAVIPSSVGHLLAVPFSWLIGLIPLPGAERIGLHWVQHDYWFVALILVIVAAFLAARTQARAIQEMAQRSWCHLAGKTQPDTTPKPGLITRLRHTMKRQRDWWTKKAFPCVLLIGIFALPPAIGIWRWYLFTPLGGNSVCTHVMRSSTNGVAKLPEITLAKPASEACKITQGVLEDTLDEKTDANAIMLDRCKASDTPFSASFGFDTKNPCMTAGIMLQEGRDYSMRIEVEEAWRDGILKADPEGLDWSEMSLYKITRMFVFSLGRRFWSEDWMALMGSIGRSRDGAFRVNVERRSDDKASPDYKKFDYKFRAWRSGRLYLFVNDGVNAFDSDLMCEDESDFDEKNPWNCYYNNNTGTAQITVTEIDER